MDNQLASYEGDAQWFKPKPIWFFRDQESRQGGTAKSLEEVTEGNNEGAIAKAGTGYCPHSPFFSSQC